MNFVIALVVIGIMICLCYFTSGISNTAGTVFERKSNTEKKSR